MLGQMHGHVSNLARSFRWCPRVDEKQSPLVAIAPLAQLVETVPGASGVI